MRICQPYLAIRRRFLLSGSVFFITLTHSYGIRVEKSFGQGHIAVMYKLWQACSSIGPQQGRLDSTQYLHVIWHLLLSMVSLNFLLKVLLNQELSNSWNCPVFDSFWGRFYTAVWSPVHCGHTQAAFILAKFQYQQRPVVDIWCDMSVDQVSC